MRVSFHIIFKSILFWFDVLFLFFECLILTHHNWSMRYRQEASRVVLSSAMGQLRTWSWHMDASSRSDAPCCTHSLPDCPSWSRNPPLSVSPQDGSWREDLWCAPHGVQPVFVMSFLASIYFCVSIAFVALLAVTYLAVSIFDTQTVFLLTWKPSL